MLTADKFKRVGYTKEEAERIDRPTISYWQDAWRRLKKNPVAMASLVVLGLILIMVIVGPYIRGYDFVSKNVKEKNQGMSAKYWFGTDYLGRDLFSRVWMGARSIYHYCACGNSIKADCRNTLWCSNGTFWRLDR